MGGLALSSFDYLAACLIVVGMVCQLLHRRLPSGLGTSLFVGATTVGIWMAASNHTWALARIEYLWLRLTAGLCLTWAFFGWLAAEPLKEKSPDPTSAPTFFAWALVTGIGAIVQACYILVFNTWYRLIEPESQGEGLLSKGALLDLSFVFLAVLLWRGTARRPAQPAMMLCLSGLTIWWTSLTIPATFGVYGERQLNSAVFRPLWWDWTFHLQFSLAWLLAAAAVIQDIGYRARRKAAWPDRLDDLLAPYSRWPAYIQLESITAGVVLVLGVYQLVYQGPASVSQGLASSVACLVAGMTCIFMTYRRWSGNTSGLGMSLVSLGIVVLCTTISSLFIPDRSRADYSARMAIALNAMLFGMAIVIAWWSWLARFWQ
ncbi:MAG TPA: hypothetical protein VMV81_03115, partial [Phycisphaerae bacterium]|nr:hypothetical protein [Phycisphaerae bacterium]